MTLCSSQGWHVLSSMWSSQTNVSLLALEEQRYSNLGITGLGSEAAVKHLQGCKAVECVQCSKNEACFSSFIECKIFLPHIRGNFPSLQYSLEQHKTDSYSRIRMESQDIILTKEYRGVFYLVEGFNWSIFFLRLHCSYGRNAWDLESVIHATLLYYTGI